MPLDSGTPTDWLGQLSAKVINVHCRCDTKLAAERFIHRKRHAGHLDSGKTPAEIRAGIERVAGFGRLGMQPSVEVDTSQPVRLDAVLRMVFQAFQTTAPRD